MLIWKAWLRHWGCSSDTNESSMLLFVQCVLLLFRVDNNGLIASINSPGLGFMFLPSFCHSSAIYVPRKQTHLFLSIIANQAKGSNSKRAHNEMGYTWFKTLIFFLERIRHLRMLFKEWWQDDNGESHIYLHDKRYKTAVQEYEITAIAR